MDTLRICRFPDGRIRYLSEQVGKKKVDLTSSQIKTFLFSNNLSYKPAHSTFRITKNHSATNRTLIYKGFDEAGSPEWRVRTCSIGVPSIKPHGRRWALLLTCGLQPLPSRSEADLSSGVALRHRAADERRSSFLCHNDRCRRWGEVSQTWRELQGVMSSRGWEKEERAWCSSWAPMAARRAAEVNAWSFPIRNITVLFCGYN